MQEMSLFLILFYTKLVRSDDDAKGERLYLEFLLNPCINVISQPSYLASYLVISLKNYLPTIKW